jgi:hypothetical protein
VNVRIINALLVIILALIPCLPTLAASDAVININMTTVETIIAINLSQSQWPLGNVTADTEYRTDPEATWCRINNTGTIKVALFTQGAHATCGDSYYWRLSGDGTNDDHSSPNYDEYALWYHMARDGNTTDPASYINITKYNEPMKTSSGQNITLARPGEPGSYKQFGLKLLTPESFLLGKQMETHITISAVAA